MAFQEEMMPYLREAIFPADILNQLRIHMKKPKSATVRDLELMRLLRSYDDPSDKVLLEDIPENQEFQLGNKRFVKKEKLRKRYRCELVGTGKVYLVSAIAEVEI